MDSTDAAATPLGAWAWIRGYFTPATFFLVVNLVIGTIALTSRAATQQRRRRREHEHYYHDDGHHHLQEAEPLLHPQMQQQPESYGHYYHPADQTLYPAPPPPAPLARTSSVLDRLRSFGLYRFRSGDFPPEFTAAAVAGQPLNYAQDVQPALVVEEEEMPATTAHYARRSEPPVPAAREDDERRPAPAPVPVPPRVKKSGSEVRKSQVARAVPRVVKAVAEDDDHSVEARAEEPVGGGFKRGPSPLQQEYHYQEEYVPPVRARAPAPAPLQRTSSVLDRLRSFSLYGFLAPDQPAVPASDGFSTPADENRHAHAHYDRSRSEPAPEQQGKKKTKPPPEAKSRMAKSSSEARKTGEAGGECVNARAEAFIDSFRQQLQQVVVQQHHYQEEEEYVPPPVPLSRTSSVLDRLRSFSLYRFRSGDLGPDLPSAAAETDDHAAAQYGRSRSEPAREQGKKKKQQQEARMSKSSSSGVVEEAETEPCVDARADDFINKFRQQLQLQRLKSLLNYKEMLGGGAKQA